MNMAAQIPPRVLLLFNLARRFVHCKKSVHLPLPAGSLLMNVSSTPCLHGMAANSYSIRSPCSLSVPRFLHTTCAYHAKKGKKHKSKVNVDMSADDSILDLEELKKDMQKVIEALKQDYTKSLSIRTSQGSLDHIMVPTSDGKFPLNQLGQITSKSASLITVNLNVSGFPQATEAAAKAIRESGMNLNPKVEGGIIQVPIPKISKEHRENLAKSAKVMCDKSKVSLRNVRSKYVSMVKKHKEGTSKDTLFQLEKQIQQVTDNFSDAAEQLLTAKTKDLLGK